MLELLGIRHRQKNPSLSKGKNKKRDAALLKRLPRSSTMSAESYDIELSSNNVNVKTDDTITGSDSPYDGRDSKPTSAINGTKKMARKNAVVPISSNDEIEALESMESLSTTAGVTTTTVHDIESNFAELKEDRFNKYHSNRNIGHNNHNKVLIPRKKVGDDDEKSFHSRIEALFHINHDNLYHSDF